jgi:tRNA threonylcarbamoyladenosine biosynthesis protein TsaB
MLLALDTATRTASLALFDERGVLGETTWHPRENHTRSLMPELVRLMDLVRVPRGELRAIGVTTGPGSFTGLRIGLSAAKGLATGLNAQLIGVPTLDVTAAAVIRQPLPVCAVLEAGRGRYGAAMYVCPDDSPQRVTDYIFGSAEQIALGARVWHADMATQLLVAGEVDATLEESFRTILPGHVIIADKPARVRRGGYLAAVAWARWRRGEVDDVPSLTPFYIPTASLA